MLFQIYQKLKGCFKICQSCNSTKTRCLSAGMLPEDSLLENTSRFLENAFCSQESSCTMFQEADIIAVPQYRC